MMTGLLRKSQDPIPNTYEPNPNIGLSGWLEKKGKFPNPSYQKRWFKQIGSKLYYFETDKSKEANGYIDLDVPFQVSPSQESPPKGYLAFFLRTPSRTYELAAPSTTFQYWADGLAEYAHKKRLSRKDSNVSISVGPPSKIPVSMANRQTSPRENDFSLKNDFSTALGTSNSMLSDSLSSVESIEVNDKIKRQEKKIKEQEERIQQLEGLSKNQQKNQNDEAEQKVQLQSFFFQKNELAQAKERY